MRKVDKKRMKILRDFLRFLKISSVIVIGNISIMQFKDEQLIA